MDESRKQFEEWALKSGHSISRDVNVGGLYVSSYTATAWVGWQASRAAIEIELPRECNPADCFTDVMIPHEVTEAIRAAGIKVKE